MTSLDQLIYTWAGRGRGGHSGFQPVAATARLTDARSTLTGAALRLCRYVPPRGIDESAEMPVSYGWLDDGPTRLVFHRIYAGRDGLGRPGNFWAHILAGPRDALPAYELAQRMSSPFWWRGGAMEEYAAGERNLRAVSLADIPLAPLPDVDDELLAALTEALLIPGTRLPYLLRQPSAQIAALVAAIGSRLPGVLETMPFSTYEPASTAARFHLVGIAGREVPANATVVAERPLAEAPVTVRRARELVLSSARDNQDLVCMSLAAAAAPDGSVSLTRFVRLLCLFDRLGEGRIEADALMPALARPASAAILLQMPAAVETLADALVAGAPVLWETLGSSAAGLPAATLAKLGTAVGDQVAARRSPELLTRAWAAASKLPSSFSHACGTAVLARVGHEPRLIQDIGAATNVALLRCAVAGSNNIMRPAVQALLASPDAYPAAADASDLPAEWRGTAIGRAMAHTPGLARQAAARLRREPGLAGPLAVALPDYERLTAVLSELSVDHALPVVLTMSEALSDDLRYELAAWFGRRLGTRERLSFLMRLAPPIRDTATSRRWAHFVADAVAHWIADALVKLDVKPVPPDGTMDLLQSIGADCTTCWLQLLRHLTAHAPGPRSAGAAVWIDKALAATDRMTSDAHQSTALDLVLFTALDTRVALASLGRLADGVGRRASGDSVEAAWLVLTAATRVTRHTAYHDCAVPCLTYVADLIDRRALRTWPTGAVRHRGIQSQSEKLASSLTTLQRTAWTKAMNADGRSKAATRWWASADSSDQRWIALSRRS